MRERARSRARCLPSYRRSSGASWRRAKPGRYDAGWCRSFPLAPITGNLRRTASRGGAGSCADEEALDRYCADPLCRPDISAALFLELLSAMRRTGGKRALASWNRCPILLLSGADDPVGAMGSGVRQLGAAMERAGLPVQTVLLPGARHDIFHEEAAAPPRRRAAAFCASAKRYWRSRRSRGINRLRRNRGAEIAPFPQKPETRRKLL